MGTDRGLALPSCRQGAALLTTVRKKRSCGRQAGPGLEGQWSTCPSSNPLPPAWHPPCQGGLSGTPEKSRPSADTLETQRSPLGKQIDQSEGLETQLS